LFYQRLKTAYWQPGSRLEQDMIPFSLLKETGTIWCEIYKWNNGSVYSKEGSRVKSVFYNGF